MWNRNRIGPRGFAGFPPEPGMRDRATSPGDYDFLAGVDTPDQTRQLPLGLMNPEHQTFFHDRTVNPDRA
jgi:hypothetical protein